MYSYFLMEFLSLKADFIDCRLLKKAYVLKAQLRVTCSKLIMKALGQGVNYIQSYRQKHRADVSVTFKHGGFIGQKA